MSISPYKACLQNVIGLSQTPCDCWTDKPEDYNTSDSGYYLDELLPINNFANLENCEDETIWDIMAKSREEAIKRYIADVKALLLQKFEVTLPYFKGKIGEAKATLALNVSGNYAGVILRCNPAKSAYMRIKAVGAIFNTTGSKHIFLYNNLGNLITEFDITTVANAYYNNILPNYIELPLYSEDTEILHYYLFYTDDAIKPLNNSLTCSQCPGFSPCWSLNGSCWKRPIKNNRFHWAKYLQVTGFIFNNLSDLYEINYGYSSAMYGLTVDVEMYCAIDDVFCTDEIIYSGSAIANAQALAIRFKAAEYAIGNNLMSDKLTRSKLINRDTLLQYKIEWQTEYEKYINFIAENFDVEQTSCLGCKDNMKAKMSIAAS